MGRLNSWLDENRDELNLSALFLLARSVMVISIPLEGLKSYGDFWNFFGSAGMGRPFFDLWLEFPPLFPWISRLAYQVAGGREHSFIYLLVLFFSLVESANLFVFQKICKQLDIKEPQRTGLFYAFLVLGLFYSWAYFDVFAVFFMLLGLYSILRDRPVASGLLLGIGGLVKWFPLIFLPAAWKHTGRKQGWRVVLPAILVIAVIWGGLYLASPEFTTASFVSQGAKGSWESIWAVLDGNLTTGNFHPAADRSISQTARLSTGNPAVISPWVTLAAFAGLGLMVFFRLPTLDNRQAISFGGLTLLMFFLWSPGYSPQWCLMLLPLLLLSFSPLRGMLMALVVLFINLLEWPILLSRGQFGFLEEIIILRTLVYLGLILIYLQQLLSGGNPGKDGYVS